MANPNAAYGLIPVRHMSGNSPRANKYTITSGLAENIFTGDRDWETISCIWICHNAISLY